MNIKRGLFRLWVIFALIFIACVMIISFDEIKAKFQEGSGKFDATHLMIMLPVDCVKARGRLTADYINNLEGGYCWYRLAKFRILYPEYKDMNDSVLKEKLYKQAESGLKSERAKNARWSYVIKILSFSVGIPLLVLFFGYLLLWAFSGFREVK